MRTFVLILQAFLFYATASASTLQTREVDGHRIYDIVAGQFSTENSALQFKLKLASLLKQPIHITQTPDKTQFAVNVGPLTDAAAAEEIQQRLNATPISPSNLPSALTSTASYPSSAQATAVSSPATADKKLWNLRNADVRAVIAEVSRITGKNFIIDPRVQGKISIVAASPLSNSGLYQVFLSMLQVSGFAAIPSGNVIKIIPNMDAKTMASTALQPYAQTARGDDMLVEVIPVRYVPAEQLVPVLRPLMPQWSNVSAYSPSNMLILSGRASNIKRLSGIIRQVDTPSANGIDIVPLKHALAMDMVNTLKDLLKTQAGSGTRSPATLAADDRSNAILLSGNRTDRLRLRLLIARLDKESLYGSHGNTQVIYLNYLRAEDLVPILAGIAQANFSGIVGTTIGTITQPALDSTNPASSLANGTTSSSGSAAMTADSSNTQNASKAAAPSTTGATTQNEGTTKPTVQIIAEPNTNSIILNAPATLIHTLKNVIAQLDIKPAQLLIEALVAEVDEADLQNLGIEWGTKQQTGNAANFRQGFAIINSKTSSTDLQAQLYALSRDRKANILSTPSVVVLDNRQAKILIGRQVSVASTTYPNNANGSTTASPYVTFDRVNVALHLYVRPQITRGQGIQLQIDQGNDTLDPLTTISGNDNPVFKISSIVTSVHVDSGDIVVLGGLTQDSLSKDDTGLPILRDIPGIGRLFQHNLRNREKRVLMVFIKPIILRTPNDAVEVTGSKYRGLRDHQLEVLREQQYQKDNPEVILPPGKRADLPMPFTNPPLRKTNSRPHHG